VRLWAAATLAHSTQERAASGASQTAGLRSGRKREAFSIKGRFGRDRVTRTLAALGRPCKPKARSGWVPVVAPVLAGSFVPNRKGQAAIAWAGCESRELRMLSMGASNARPNARNR
jgi:hypothetical protein